MIRAVSILERWNAGWPLIDSLSTVWQVKDDLDSQKTRSKGKRKSAT